jgi:hypothetical protein
MEFRVLCLTHLFELFGDPGYCLILGAAMTTSTRDFNAASGESAPLMSLGDNGVVHASTKRCNDLHSFWSKCPENACFQVVSSSCGGIFRAS